jgi:hypothetical protein
VLFQCYHAGGGRGIVSVIGTRVPNYTALTHRHGIGPRKVFSLLRSGAARSMGHIQSQRATRWKEDRRACDVQVDPTFSPTAGHDAICGTYKCASLGAQPDSTPCRGRAARQHMPRHGPRDDTARPDPVSLPEQISDIFTHSGSRHNTWHVQMCESRCPT